VCDSDRVRQFLDLGELPLANRFLTAAELSAPEPSYPLRAAFCECCAHVQLVEHVPPEAMFEEYLYISSMSDTLVRHFDELAGTVVSRCGLTPRNLVVDIGSNDGTLLAAFQRRGVRTLGVDPARNLADRARQAGIETHVGFFDSAAAAEILARHGQASVVTATNSFPHIQDLGLFLAALDALLEPAGVLVIEAHYLADLLEQCAFDTIYHEHVSYWALGPMVRLFAGHGFEVVHAEHLPLHHGQLRVFVQRAGAGVSDATVAERLRLEEASGLADFETFRRFAGETQRIKEQLRRLLDGLRATRQRVVGYGAPAKGNTLLGFAGIGPDQIEYIVDRSPLKQGCYTPGMHIPVVAPERLLEDQPPYALLLAWNFADEIFAQQAEYRNRGGRFIVPLPHVEVI